jgi:NAD(P)H-hydrate repair Nnr-like enzyme with NAD(P)H-hydrate epimerase domain
MSLYHKYSIDDEVLSVAEVVALEQGLAAEGTPLLELMRRAGAALAQAARGCCQQGRCRSKWGR